MSICRSLGAVTAGILVLIAGCSDGGTAPDGGFTISIESTTLSVPQDGSGSVTVNVTRTGTFTGPVSVAIEGLPANVIATPNPATIAAGGSSATISFAASGAAATTTSNVTVRATGGGETRTASLSLTVTGGVSVTYRICADEPVVFAAGQDGSGDFQPLTIADGTVTFDVTSGRGALAYVTQADAVTYTTRILYWTASELNHSATPCVSPSIPGTKTLTGGFANFGDGNYAEVAIGGAYQYGSPQSPSFSMSNVTDGPTDAIAFLFNFSGGPFSADRGIIRRGVNYTGTVPVFDFAAPESFATVPRSLTINNVGTDLLAWVTVDFQTQRGVAAFLYNEFETRTTATRQVPTVPNPQPGDLHSVAVRAVDEGMERQVWTYFAEGADQTVTLGPVPSPVTVTEVASGPSKRLRVQYAVQSEYDRRHFGFFTQGSRTLIVNISQAYLGGSNVDYTIPDLTGVTGFPAAAAFGPGPVDWQAGGFEYTGDATPADGEVIKLFWRYGSI